MRNWIIAVSFAGSSLLVFNLVSFYSFTDDAYISFRYLDNWLAGNGLVFNPGERVEGYTNFLWIVLLAPLSFFGLSPETGSMLLSLCALAILLWCLFQTASSLTENWIAGWCAVLLAAGSVHLSRWTVSGMETVFFAMLLAYANMHLAKRFRHSYTSSIFYSLAVLTRPTAALHAAIAFAVAIPFKGEERIKNMRLLMASFIVFLILPLAHLIFRLAYYGYPLPNTFYAKVGGELPNLVPAGMIYVWRFLIAGGIILVVTSLFSILKCRKNWVILVLFVQVFAHTFYVIRVGGDYFPFNRFLVPIIPALAVLGGIGLATTARRFGALGEKLLPVAVLFLTFTQTGLSFLSVDNKTFEQAVTVRSEREITAGWLKDNLPQNTKLAVNAAGVIPYRTGFYTLDMLGLNDLHIARAKVTSSSDGEVFVGHYKHDGTYVCESEPDAVLTSGGALFAGRNASEAIIQSAINTFPGDREFLRAPSCQDWYRPVATELEPGKFAVIHLRNKQALKNSELDSKPGTAEEWFQRGIALMRGAKFREAIDAFQRSLKLKPDHITSLTNMGYSFLDLNQNQQAINIFERVLIINRDKFDALYGQAMAHENLNNKSIAIELWRRYIKEAPDSPWKDKAKEHLDLLLHTIR